MSDIDRDDLAALTDRHPGTNLRRVLVCSFEGWTDAGGAASSATEHLIEALRLEVVDRVDAEDYVDYQVSRPRVIRVNGERQMRWPAVELHGSVQHPSSSEDEPVTAKPETSTGEERSTKPTLLDTVVSLGDLALDELYVLESFEPALRWQHFAKEIAELAASWQFDLVIMLHSMYSDTPHSRPVPIHRFSESVVVRDEFGAQRSDYEGPTGVASVVDMALKHAEIPVLNVWANVPHYVQGVPWPKATLALLDALEESLNLVIPRGELLDSAQTFEDHVTNAANNDADMGGYVRQLEQQRDQLVSTQQSAASIVEEFEQMLRGQGQEAESEGNTPSHREDDSANEPDADRSDANDQATDGEPPTEPTDS